MFDRDYDRNLSDAMTKDQIAAKAEKMCRNYESSKGYGHIGARRRDGGKMKKTSLNVRRLHDEKYLVRTCYAISNEFKDVRVSLLLGFLLAKALAQHRSKSQAASGQAIAR